MTLPGYQPWTLSSSFVSSASKAPWGWRNQLVTTSFSLFEKHWTNQSSIYHLNRPFCLCIGSTAGNHHTCILFFKSRNSYFLRESHSGNLGFLTVAFGMTSAEDEADIDRAHLGSYFSACWKLLLAFHGLSFV